MPEVRSSVRRLRIGCEFNHVAQAATPATFMVRPGAGTTVLRELWTSDPAAGARSVADAHGNELRRVLLPEGESLVSYYAVVEVPDELDDADRISKTVMEKGLDAGTAFEILSIDIADVDVGANIGAKLQMDQAEADKNIAQAKAEGRRAMAVAQEQENIARLKEAHAKVAEAEAEVPKAIAEALRAGRFGYMDYLQMKNLEADTGMRQHIGAMTGTPEQK